MLDKIKKIAYFDTNFILYQ